MDVSLMALPWTKFKTWYDEGKLHDDDFTYSEEYDEFWDEALDLSDVTGDPFLPYNGLCDDSSFIADFDFPGNKEFVAFSSQLINEEFESDLTEKGEIECIATVISPTRISQLSELAKKIDFDALKAAHIKLKTEGYDLGGEPYKVHVALGSDRYTHYIQSLAKFVHEIEGTDRCIVIHMG